MTTILGLDVSSVSTGCAVLIDGYIIQESLYTITPPKKIEVGKKLLYFSKEIEKLITKYTPDIVVEENIYRGPSTKTFRVLSMFMGVCFLSVAKLSGKDPLCIMPTEARKLIGINKIDKEDVFEQAVNKFKLENLNFKDHNDIVDAIILAYAGWKITSENIQIEPKNKTKKRKRK